MSVFVAEPSQHLRPYVRSILVIEHTAPVLNVLLPEPGIVLGFRVGGSPLSIDADNDNRLSTAGITGLRTRVRRIWTSAGATVLAAFRPLGAARFFEQPIHEMFGAMVPFADITSRAETAEIEERIADSTDAAGRAHVLDQYLCKRLGAREPDALARAAVDQILRAGGNVRVRHLARSLGTSQDPLEKRFRREVGASPKQFASIVRFRHVISTYRPTSQLTSLAYAAGYFDQSHFIRDFRAFTGETPAHFFRATEYCSG